LTNLHISSGTYIVHLCFIGNEKAMLEWFVGLFVGAKRRSLSTVHIAHSVLFPPPSTAVLPTTFRSSFSLSCSVAVYGVLAAGCYVASNAPLSRIDGIIARKTELQERPPNERTSQTDRSISLTDSLPKLTNCGLIHELTGLQSTVRL
jgi:hypothetical protein